MSKVKSSTAYSKAADAKAGSLRRAGNGNLLDSATSVLGALAGGSSALSNPGAKAEKGITQRRQANSTQARGHAVDGLIANRRGGSPALGMRGNVPASGGSPGASLTPGQQTQFSKSNAHYESQKHAADVGAEAHGAMQGNGKGFGNKNNQDAAQAARKAKRGG